MPQFTYNPISNGQTSDVSQVNTPFAAVAAALNNIDSTNVTPGSLTAASFTDADNPQKRYKKAFTNFVVSGLTIPTSGTLTTTTAAGEAFVNGKDISPGSNPHTYTASKDTYVDLKDDGTYVNVEVTNNATSGMPLTTNSDGSNALRIAKVVTSGSAVVQVLQNAISNTPVSPNTQNWYGFDALGNLVYNCDPSPRLIGCNLAYANLSTASTTVVDSLFAVTFIVPTARTVRIVLESGAASVTSSGIAQCSFWDGGTVGTGSALYVGNFQSSNNGLYMDFPATLSAGTHTIKMGYLTTAGTFTFAGSATSPSQFRVYLER